MSAISLFFFSCRFHMYVIHVVYSLYRCGRPNLNHVTECYKCGATLAPTANKWIYVGSHSGRGGQSIHVHVQLFLQIIL